MFKPTTARTPEEYISLIDSPRKEEIVKLDKFIKKLVPQFKPKLYGSIIGYGNYHYKSKSGREGDWMIIGLASQKNYISIYACATKNGKYIAEENKDKLGKVSVGRSCIRFKNTNDVDMDTLKKVILESVDATRPGE